MKQPDHRLFQADLEGAEYRAGALKGLWGIAFDDAVSEGLAWPHVCFWLAAASRESAPERYYVMLDLAGYRGTPPTGTFWNPVTKTALALSEFPKGRPGSRFSGVFRTDWESGRAFYHPYDRFALSTHSKWTVELPHLVWGPRHTIVDYLEEFQSLLNSEDYLGK